MCIVHERQLAVDVVRREVAPSVQLAPRPRRIVGSLIAGAVRFNIEVQPDPAHVDGHAVEQDDVDVEH